MSGAGESRRKNRLALYFAGFFVMTLGIAISVKSDLGVSPVSSIPYTITCVFGIEMGKATILFHIGLVILQILALRKAFQVKNLLQIVVGVIFGYFTTFCNYLMTFLPDPSNFGVRLGMMLVSVFLIAFGIFLYVPTDIMPLAGEGAMLAIAQVSGVAVSLVTCLVMLHALGSVGVGTVVAAVLVGVALKGITKVLGKLRDAWLGISVEQPCEE